ncbi:MAG TPA: 16S rRNA (cytosine(1402)-N(4))-methyltransferase RsmH [Thermomicrobiales bacterium]|nr:16S rRNA (cytosine(1402)-N(4))-methyltransferase RsmH [Thermomicrobiales bacterium]
MMTTEPTHTPVLLAEAITQLVQIPTGTYIDGTFGGGGHSRYLLEHFPQASIVAFDRDPAAITRAVHMQREFGVNRLQIVQAPFADMQMVVSQLGTGAVAGILLDLGYSSFQIDDPRRGFAFRTDGPLDMRFDPTTGPSAVELLATLDEAELADVIWRYGDERRSRAIARAIVARRETDPVHTTRQLAELVAHIVGHQSGRGHPATRTFQAVRIAVNKELEQLERVLANAAPILVEGGRLVVISFHSLEDRMTKQFMASASATCLCPPEQIVCTCQTVPAFRRVGRAIRPSASEGTANPRSRSAVMRVAERINVSPGAS